MKKISASKTKLDATDMLKQIFPIKRASRLSPAICIALEYLKVGKTENNSTILLNNPRIPKCSGVYNLVNNGEEISKINWEITLPVRTVKKFLAKADLRTSPLNFSFPYIKFILRLSPLL